MTAEQLLAELRGRGVALRAVGGRLKYDGELSDDELDQLAEHKAELLELLAPPAPRPQPAPTRVRISSQPPPEPPPPEPAAEWWEPDPVRSERARNWPRDTRPGHRGKFLPSGARQAADRQAEAEQLLAQLDNAGVRLRAHGDRVRMVAGELTADQVGEVRRLKAELLPLLPRLSGYDRWVLGADVVA